MDFPVFTTNNLQSCHECSQTAKNDLKVKCGRQIGTNSDARNCFKTAKPALGMPSNVSSND